MKPTSVVLPISTSAGRFRARYSEKGLAELAFPSAAPASSAPGRRRGDESPFSPVAGAPGRDSSRRPRPAKIRRWHRLTETALKRILAGHAAKKIPPLDLVGTEFQKSVWHTLRKISPGKTRSYGEIARAIGKPKAVRAVGGACGANPIPVLVPCHRVLAANKKLGGFSGGLDWKRELLRREGVMFR